MEVLRKPQLDKLRWYQYSLKSLFLFSIFFAVCVSILTIWIEFRSHGKISLITAAKNGDLKEVKWLLDHGADINASVCHDTALIFASGAGQIKVVKYLVSQGADINAGKDHGRSALVQAICNHHPDIAVWLIQQGADVNARDENKDMPLHYTAHYGNAFISKCLLEKGADINARGSGGRTPLYATICYRGRNDISVAKVLLDNGADPNICGENDRGFGPGYSEITPLTRAVHQQETEMVELLKKYGAK